MSRVARVTWRELEREAAARLVAAGIEQPVTEVRWMVETVSGYDRAELVVAAVEPCPGRAAALLDALVTRRVSGEPLQYVLAEWSFHGLDLFVDRRVLIPRPETEVLAEVAIAHLRQRGALRGRADPWAGDETRFVAADLGTGSGALALALVDALADVEVWATDASPDALAVARANVASLGNPSTRVRVVDGDWYDALPTALVGRLDLVVCNPPYVSEAEYDMLDDTVRLWEPRGALVSGPTGLECLEHVVARAPEWLAAGGTLACEIAPHQAELVVARVRNTGLSDVEVIEDLAGRARVVVGVAR